MGNWLDDNTSVDKVAYADRYYTYHHGEAQCIELDSQSQELLMYGWCRKIEMDSVMLIPKGVVDIILYYYRQMEDVWVETEQNMITKVMQEVNTNNATQDVYVYGTRVKNKHQNSHNFYSW